VEEIEKDRRIINRKNLLSGIRKEGKDEIGWKGQTDDPEKRGAKKTRPFFLALRSSN